MGLLAMGCIHWLHSVCRWYCTNLIYCLLTAVNVRCMCFLCPRSWYEVSQQ